MGLTAKDYADQLLKLLPYGPAWDGEHPALIGGAAELARTTSRVDALAYEETDPRQTTHLLQRYEQLCGLPDSCVVGMQTVLERQQRLAAKMLADGGINEGYYLSLLASLGYPDATITKYHHRTFTPGSRAGDQLYSPVWRFVWTVNLPSSGKVTYFTPGSRAGDQLRVWGDAEVQCVISKLAPPNTHVNFRYQGE